VGADAVACFREGDSTESMREESGDDLLSLYDCVHVYVCDMRGLA
jgi:hypothetical protein